MNILYMLPLLLSAVAAADSFPALIFSHRLVPYIRSNLPHSEQVPFTLDEATDVIDRITEQCLSDAYIVVDQPGLAIEDLTNFHVFPHMRDMMTRASTIVTFPQIMSETPLDLEHIESHIYRNCYTKKHEVLYNDENEVPEYIDTRKRYIKVNLPQLPLDEMERAHAFLDHDFLLKRIVRKLPSPYVTVIYTSSTPMPFREDKHEAYEYHIDEIPDDSRLISKAQMKRALYSLSTIFPDITIFDKTRWFEYERNDRGVLDDSIWSKDKDGRKEDETWIAKKKKEVVVEPKYNRFGEDDNTLDTSILNKKLIMDNASLVMGIFSCLALIVLYNFIKISVRGLKMTWRLLFKKKAE